jgi:hypothetical protein
MAINWLVSRAQARRVAQEVRALRNHECPNIPIIYLPGILGVKLYDRLNQACIWGDYRGTLFRKKHHAGYALDDGDSSNVAVPGEVLHHFTIIPKVLDTLVTAELKHTLEQSMAYREGRDLFFLSYDWRQDYRVLARRIEEQIETIRRDYGPTQQVILLGQSAANLAVRYLMRTGTQTIRDSIAKWYAFGPTWKGTFNALKMLREGYYPAGKLFHGFSPEDSMSYPGCHQLLPRNAKMLSPTGEELADFELYDASCWAEYGLGPKSLKESWSTSGKVLQGQLDRAKALHDDVDGQDDTEGQVPQTWFAGTKNEAVTAAVAHDEGALVSEKAIRKYAPKLAAKTLALGDDHIPLAHLAEQPCGPLVESYDSIPFGENYVLVGRPKDHRAIINFRPNLKALAMDIATVNAQQ